MVGSTSGVVTQLQLLERPDGREQHAQADIDEIHVRDRERDVAAQRNALVQDAVDELEQRDLLLQRRPARRRTHANSDGTKLYGGHGPVTSNVTPEPPYRCASSCATSLIASTDCSR